MTRGPQATVPNMAHPRPLRTYKTASIGRMGIGGMGLLGKQESIIEVLLEIARTKWAVKIAPERWVLLTRKGFGEGVEYNSHYANRRVTVLLVRKFRSRGVTTMG